MSNTELLSNRVAILTTPKPNTVGVYCFVDSKTVVIYANSTSCLKLATKRQLEKLKQQEHSNSNFLKCFSKAKAIPIFYPAKDWSEADQILAALANTDFKLTRL